MFRKLAEKQVLVKPDPRIKKSKSGFIVPETAEMGMATPRYGKVLQIGDKVAGVKVGDRVYFKRYAGFMLESKDGERFLMAEDEILAKME